MQIWNKQTKVSNVIDEDVIPEGWTSEQPKWLLHEIWDNNNNCWSIISIDQKKEELIMLCKEISSDNIYEIYPIYKQINLQSELSRQSIIVSIGMCKSIEAINAAVYSLILSLNTLEDAIAFRNSIPTMDLSSYVSGATAAQQPSIITAYRKILTCMVSDRIVQFVRDWCNTKISAIKTCTTLEQLELISLKDCPIIS